MCEGRQKMSPGLHSLIPAWSSFPRMVFIPPHALHMPPSVTLDLSTMTRCMLRGWSALLAAWLLNATSCAKYVRQYQINPVGHLCFSPNNIISYLVVPGRGLPRGPSAVTGRSPPEGPSHEPHSRRGRRRGSDGEEQRRERGDPLFRLTIRGGWS